MLLTTVLVGAALLAPELIFTDFSLIASYYEVSAGAISTTSILSMCAAALLVLATVLPLITIFIYKKRRVQMRFLRLEFVLLLVGGGCLGYYLWMTDQSLTAPMPSYSYIGLILSVVLPVVLIVVFAVLTNLLALRGVRRDERLVRSIDRIR
jgi:hypothetical protein